MSSKVKIILPIFAVVFLLVVAAVIFDSKRTNILNAPTIPGTKNTTPQNVDTGVDEPEEIMPQATGQVDDAVDAIIDGVTSEEVRVLSDEKDAQTAVDDSEDMDNLKNTYDQDQF